MGLDDYDQEKTRPLNNGEIARSLRGTPLVEVPAKPRHFFDPDSDPKDILVENKLRAGLSRVLLGSADPKATIPLVDDDLWQRIRPYFAGHGAEISGLTIWTYIGEPREIRAILEPYFSDNRQIDIVVPRADSKGLESRDSEMQRGLALYMGNLDDFYSQDSQAPVIYENVRPGDSTLGARRVVDFGGGVTYSRDQSHIVSQRDPAIGGMQFVGAILEPDHKVGRCVVISRPKPAS